MILPEIHLDLSLAPQDRWRELATHADDAGRLLDSYVRDLGGAERFGALLEPYLQAFVDAEHRAELAAIAKIVNRSIEEVALANFYYEALQQNIGCSAFACDTPDGPIHARNLDWWTDDDMLARLTCIVRADGGASVGPFQLVTWPGFIGAFSALAPGRFAITLNAVTSDEPAAYAQPIVTLIRRALETCREFDEAVALLERTPIAADCLLLVSGIRQGEMVVIERTSTRAALRGPDHGFVAVTNDYKILDGAELASGNALQQTACARFDRTVALVGDNRSLDAAACLHILGDDAIQMAITVQQMVMRARTGELVVELPSPAW